MHERDTAGLNRNFLFLYIILYYLFDIRLPVYLLHESAVTGGGFVAHVRFLSE